MIRGPGASLWGVNAINGIISIVTKAAQKDKSSQGYASVGNVFRRGVGGSVQGEVLGRAIRLSVNSQTMQNQRSGAQVTGDDNAGQCSLNLRLDSKEGDIEWTTQVRGNVSELDGISVGSSLLSPPLDPANYGYPPNSGAVRLGVSENARYRNYFTSVQQSVQRLQGNTPLWRVVYGVSRQGFQDMVPGTVAVNTADVDAYTRAVFGSHRLLYGLSGKINNDTWKNDSALFTLANRSTTKGIVSGFLQDAVGLFNDAINLTVGTKVQYNDYSGFEHEPSVRVSVPIATNCTAWLAWSRSVRIPNRVNKGFADNAFIAAPSQDYGPLPIDLRLGPDPLSALSPEVLYAHELGARGEKRLLGRMFSWDVSLFYNQYSDLIGTKVGDLAGPPQFQAEPIPHLVGQLSGGNLYSLYSWGGEAQAVYQLSPSTRITTWYSGQSTNDRGDIIGPALAPSHPKHQALVRIATSPWSGSEFDVTLRTNTGGVGGSSVTDNRALDLRIAQNLSRQLSTELLGTDLLHATHKEGYLPWAYNFRPVGLIQRGLLARVRYQW